MTKTALLAALLAGTAFGSAASAQTTSPAVPPPAPTDTTSADVPAPASSTGTEDIVVTGSRLPSTSLTASAPVNVLNAQQIKATGATNVRELLRVLPAATATTGESAGRGNNGTATVALRGLSAVNTLVLIDGRRVLANSAGGTVDLNSIPFAAIERVEVLQDGASAIYGSDAIAGVVNIILKKSYTGLYVNLYSGVSSRGDLPAREADLVFGHDFDRGGFALSASYRKSDGNLIADRPISKDVDWRNLGGRNFRDPLPTSTAFTFDKNNPYGLPAGQYIIKNGVTQVTSPNDLRPFLFPEDASTPGGDDGINFWDYESSADAIDTTNIYFNGHYDVTSSIQAYTQLSYNHRDSLGYLAPDYIGAVYGQAVTVAADNIYNSFGIPVQVARTIAEEPLHDRRQSDVHADTYRIIAGLKGSLFGGWTWDASYNYQHLSQYTFLGHGIVYSKIQEAAGGPETCNAAVDGCVPINFFGGTGAITPAMLSFITADSSEYVTSSLKSAVVNAGGKLFHLPAGDVNVSLGAEYREESFSLDADTLSEENAFVGRGIVPDAFPPTRKIAEFYGEIGVPLLHNLPLIDSLSVDGAVRYSHYNVFGGTTNPKFGVKWRPFHDLLVRGTWGTGFRAPTFTEAYSGQTNGFQPIIDPCVGPNYAQYPGCGGKQVITNSTGAYVITGGNPNLKPETARNLTIGLVYTPRFAPGLAFTADFFHIHKDNIIGNASVNYLIAQNVLNGSYAGDVTRDPTTGIISSIIALRDNLLDQDIKGIDGQISYNTVEHSWGKLSLQANVTYLDSFKLSPAPGAAEVEDVGTYEQAYGTLSRFRGNMIATWSLANFSLSYNGRFVGAVDNLDSLVEPDGSHWRAGSYIQHDLQLAVDVKPDATFTFGVRNLFDRMPPFLEGNYANGFDQTTFDSIGRYFYFSASKKF